MYAVQQSVALTVPVFAFDSAGDPVTGKVTGDWTKRISKASGAFAAMTVTVTEKEGGWYDVVMTTSHTDTLGLLTVYLTATGVKQINLQWMVTIAGEGGANLTHIDGLATSSTLATLNLKQLNVVNTAGSAIVASSTGSNGHGIDASGNGSGVGVKALGGDTGRGIWGAGGGTGGHGIVATASGNNAHALMLSGHGSGAGLYAVGGATGAGVQAVGQGTGTGLLATGGATGHGIEAVGGATSGNGVTVTATAGNGHGVATTGQGAGNGLHATGGASGTGLAAVGGATAGHGLNVSSGGTTGYGFRATGMSGGAILFGASGNGHGLAVTGIGTGAGLSAQGGATGHGLAATGGATSGDAIHGTVTSGDALGDDLVDSILTRDMGAEPTGVPAATGSLASKIGRIYATLRNKVTVTATEKTLFNDAGTAEWKKPVSDSAGTYTEDEGTTP